MKKTFLTIFTLVVVSGVFSCSERCDGSNTPYFDIRGFNAEIVARADTSWAVNHQQITPLDSGSYSAAKRTGIQLNATVSFHTSLLKSNNWPAAAFACSPTVPGEQGSKENISSIVVISDADFDAAHPAGSVLNDFFMISATSPHYYEPRDDVKHTAIPLSVYLAQQPRARRTLQLWLTQRPETSSEHRFTVTYRQTNGEEYILQAPKVTFQ